MNRTIIRRLKDHLPSAVRLLAAGVLAGLWTLAGPPTAGAEVPEKINFQGRLIDPGTKNPLAGPTVDMKFRICDHPTNPCTGASKLWEEPSGASYKTIDISNGVFETVLGDVVAVTTDVFDGSAQYLEIQVENETLSPRQQLVASPMALRATVAESLAAGDPNYVQVTESLQQGATYYVSSGTVAGQLTAGTIRLTGSLTVEGVIVAGSGGEQLTSAAGLLDASKLDPASTVPNESLDASSVAKLSGGLIPNWLIDGSSVPKLGLDGYVPSEIINPSSVAKLSGGMIPNWLIDQSSVPKLTPGGLVPNELIDQSSVPKLTAGGLIPNEVIDGSSVAKLNASGKIEGSLLPSNVTLQGNTFNDVSQLVQMNGSGQLDFTADVAEVEITTHVLVTGHISATDHLCQLVDTAGGTTVTTIGTWVSHPFDTETVVDGVFTHSTVTNPERLTVNRTGLYRVSYSVSMETNANGRSSAEHRVYRNGSSEVVPSRTYSYHRDGSGEDNDTDTGSGTFLVNLNAGDYLELQSDKIYGSNMSSIANTVWLTAEFVR